MRNIKFFGYILIFIFATGCGEPTIDASSDESMKTSVDKIRETLSDSKQKEFDDAMKVIAFSGIDIKDFFAESATNSGNLEREMRQSLDGKTGAQVIDEAERINSERKKQERKQALSEIQELELKRTNSDIAQDKLKKFKVERSRFYFREQEYSGKEPIIELTVLNGTDQAISRAYFEGTLISPNRSIPWIKDTFNYSISGGLEPGERASWTLAPNMYSDWGKVDAPSDAVFTVIVEQLDGANDEPIFSIRDFSEEDEERLNELKKKYGFMK